MICIGPSSFLDDVLFVVVIALFLIGLAVPPATAIVAGLVMRRRPGAGLLLLAAAGWMAWNVIAACASIPLAADGPFGTLCAYGTLGGALLGIATARAIEAAPAT